MPAGEAPGASGGDRLAIFVATSGHSGVDRLVRNLARQLDAWGLGVDLLGIRGHGPNLETGSMPNVRALDLGCAHVAASLPALVRYLRREPPRAMLTDKDRVNRIAILARKLAGASTRLAVRVGTTVSVNLASRGAFERWQQRTSIRRLYPLADCVLVPSAGVAEDMVRYTGIDSEHIRVVPSPILTPELFERAREPLDHPWLKGQGIPVILSVGELGHRKDYETLMQAFALVRRRLPCRLVILGRGRRREALLTLAGELGVSGDVDLPGFQPNPYAFMARADLFVLSSRWEGMPVVLVEALALHRPVVATDCPSGPREILSGSGLGTLVPVGGVVPMAEAIEHWLGARVADLDFERVVADYRVESGTCAYLDALGMRCPMGANRGGRGADRD
jgi:glycosyltransferase involved in cell wall biosynthesis